MMTQGGRDLIHPGGNETDLWTGAAEVPVQLPNLTSNDLLLWIHGESTQNISELPVCGALVASFKCTEQQTFY